MAAVEEDAAPAAAAAAGSSDNEITVEEASFVHTEPPQDGSAPPVVSSDMEVLRDKVRKQVIKEGHGKRPLKFATCFEKKEMSGLGIGVSNMRSGEHALVHVGWELGYGKEGSFSFPNVPPMADLVYDVELI